MRIAISLAAANDPGAHRWLDRIVARIEDGWHIWDTTELERPCALESTSWFREAGRQRPLLRELFRAAIRREAWSYGPHGKRIRVSQDEVTAEDAFRLADRPLTLLVENRESDGDFLRRVICELDRALHKLMQVPSGPIQVDSVGGAGQMRQEVDRRREQIPTGIRLVAITDSDRRGPEDQESPTARRLRRACEEARAGCWILAKREAENYLPRTLLDARPNAGEDHARKVDAWDWLSEDQKDFFDMKHGFTKETSVPDLFTTVSPRDRARLAPGFGPKLAVCWSVWGVQTRSDLIVRSRGDLEHGLELIRSQV